MGEIVPSPSLLGCCKRWGFGSTSVTWVQWQHWDQDELKSIIINVVELFNCSDIQSAVEQRCNLLLRNDKRINENLQRHLPQVLCIFLSLVVNGFRWSQMILYDILANVLKNPFYHYSKISKYVFRWIKIILKYHRNCYIYCNFIMK